MDGRKIILAIDDNAFQLKLYKEMLVPRYDLRVVKAAADALTFFKTNKVDVILLDIEMPDISGFEFLDTIREIPNCTGVPVIIVSGNSDQQFLSQAKNSSATDTLIKPVLPDNLVATIEKALGNG